MVSYIAENIIVWYIFIFNKLGENVFWIIINIIILRSAWQDHNWNGKLRLIII